MRQEGARRAEDQDRFVTGLLLEQGSNLFRGFGEIRRDGDMGHAGIRRRRKRRQKRYKSGCKGGQLQG